MKTKELIRQQLDNKIVKFQGLDQVVIPSSRLDLFNPARN